MTASPGLMAGKKGLIMGVANDRSIAWGIAQQVAAQGGQIGFTYQGEALEKRVRPLAQSVNSELILPCDVSDSASVEAVFQEVKTKWGTLDFVVHAIGFSDKDQLRGRYINTTRDNFLKTMDISVFSFTEVCKQALPLMPNGGSLLTLTYFGAVKVIPHYNVMGVAKAALEASVKYLAADLGRDNIRVNGISAGPIKTLAASGIGDFRHIMRWNELNAPLHKNVTIEDVGKSGLYFLSDLSSGVTGEIHYVDSGYNVVGMMDVHSTAEIAEMLQGVKISS
jgi:enoyl-[acyl-carrier protein] reductase I